MHSLTHSLTHSPTHFSGEKSSSSSSSNANEGRSKKSSDILRVVSVEKGGGEVRREGRVVRRRLMISLGE